jgi:hypothetical protein
MPRQRATQGGRYPSVAGLIQYRKHCVIGSLQKNTALLGILGVNR